ncbi:hypothetical protein FOVG_18174 [Fusarium oxysporum f. sp. pisi HDV247]|nr:hypothetical protein FOVG_18174 [Fusarium oxysporum f. sp. pisi HDV247]
MTSRLSSARKRGRRSLNKNVTTSSDYPTQRAVVAAKHIHQACGKWPNDGHTPVDDETHGDDDDDVADSEVIEANSEPADEIIALGLPKNRSRDKGDKQSEDHEVTVETKLVLSKNDITRQEMGPLRSKSTSQPKIRRISLNQNSEQAQVNGQSGADLSRSNSNSTAAESGARPQRRLQKPSRLIHVTPRSSVCRSGGSEEDNSTYFAPETSQESKSSTQPQAPPNFSTPSPLPAITSPVILPRFSDVIGLEAIWIGLDLSENCWTGFGFLEDLDWIGLIGNQLLELQCKTMEAIASLVTSAVLLLWQTYLNSPLTSYTMATISSYFGPGSCRRPDPERVILDPMYLNPRPNDHDGILIEPDEFERNGKQYVRYSVR